jgi:molybdate transport system ATP-binding protein
MAITFRIKKKLGNFELNAAGEIAEGLVGIFGESGSGKTSLLKCLTGFIRPDEGEIAIGARVIFSSSKNINVPIQKRNIGIVFQDALLFPHLTVRQNIVYGLSSSQAAVSFEKLVELLRLEPILSRKPLHLSGGETQRVALARTLIRKPSLILMDEPVSSLDLKSRVEVLGYLREVPRAFGIPLIYVSHLPSELLSIVRKVMVMDQGQNIAYGDVNQTLLDRAVLRHWDPLELENSFEGVLTAFEPDAGQGIIDFDGHPLSVYLAQGEIGSRVRGYIRARDIIVARERVQGLSARNILPAAIRQIVPTARGILLRVALKHHTLWVDITPQAYKELELQSGQNIYLIIKASSIRII